ncbi:hypothetical protein AVEN_74373-1, partial [Araneus ventricosus]
MTTRTPVSVLELSQRLTFNNPGTPTGMTE